MTNEEHYDRQHPIPYRVRAMLTALVRPSITTKLWIARNAPVPGQPGRPWERMWDDITLAAREVLEEANG